MTTAEAARLLGRSRETVRRKCADGRLPGAHRPGRDWVVPPAAVEALRRERERA